ncbi:MAG: hypothetical protein AAGA87_06915 [Pseudomonadota bacterium]
MALILGAFLASRALADWAAMEAVMPGMLLGLMGLYIGLTAIPFVPGAEIGFALLAAFGGEVAWVVYGGMLGALSLSYAAGRYVPAKRLGRALGWLGFDRARALVEDMPRDNRAAFLEQRLTTRVLPFLLRHRYLTLGILLNMPGNTLLGGGGGIAFVAGASRLYSPLAFLATIAVAVAPVPLAFFIFG